MTEKKNHVTLEALLWLTSKTITPPHHTSLIRCDVGVLPKTSGEPSF